MEAVPDETLIAWCDHDPQTRYPFAAAIAALFNLTNDESPQGWKTLPRTLLTKAPDKGAVFSEIASRVRPTGGMGSLSSRFETRLKLLSQLDISDMPELAEPMEKAQAALRSETEMWRGTETDRDRECSSRFE
jgi:hypothetical protein